MIEKVLNAYLGRVAPVDPSVWHKWEVLWPVQLISGKRARPIGQLWRRRGVKGWEYRQDAETMDDGYNDA